MNNERPSYLLNTAAKWPSGRDQGPGRESELLGICEPQHGTRWVIGHDPVEVRDGRDRVGKGGE